MERLVQPWRDWKAAWMWHLETWINGGLGSAGERLGSGISKGFSNLSDSGIVGFSALEAARPRWGRTRGMPCPGRFPGLPREVRSS